MSQPQKSTQVEYDWPNEFVRSEKHPDSRSIVNASQLEYRLSLPSDKFKRNKRMPDDGNFVAVNPLARKRKAVVASLGFGLVSRPKYGKWVYIDDVKVREDWRRKGVATQLIKQLLAYLYEGWPDVDGAYLGVLPTNEPAIRLYKKLGFVYKGVTGAWDGYVFSFSSPSAVANLPKDPPLTEMRLPAITDLDLAQDYYNLFVVGYWYDDDDDDVGVLYEGEAVELQVLARSALHPASSITIDDASRLEYRCALPSDKLARDARQMDDSADFVAVDPTAKGGEPVVGSLEYALMSVPGAGEWVYIDAVDDVGVGVQIHKGWPDVDGAYLVVGKSEKSAKDLYEKVGFNYKGKSGPYDGYVFYFDSPSANLPKDLPSIDISLPLTTNSFVEQFFYDLMIPDSE
ncbi:hypothetical protein FOZ62_023595 [Perkinsus olseni]|uniref:N-acetyltransferase domain-containing protein n=1 Tax=Perkinsus olseni TaxID=32597 RepID=A0A7J6Q8C5_PEROL|nr:hypothetical protein FOZ62_023595 [Perkinsus olseni]